MRERKATPKQIHYQDGWEPVLLSCIIIVIMFVVTFEGRKELTCCINDQLGVCVCVCVRERERNMFDCGRVTDRISCYLDNIHPVPSSWSLSLGICECVQE